MSDPTPKPWTKGETPLHLRRVRVQAPVGETTRTQQHMGPACNINNIMKKYLKTGVIEHWNQRKPEFGDFSQAVDLQAAIQLVDSAQEEFLKLSSEVRNVAKNDPVLLLQLLATEQGTEALKAAGMEFQEESKGAPAPALPSEGAPAPSPSQPPVSE